MSAFSAAEYFAWHAYRASNGFPVDRLAGGVAIGAAAVCQTWGGRVTPEMLLPKFSAPRRQTLAELTENAKAAFGADGWVFVPNEG